MSNMADEPRLSREELVRQLGASIGQEKADEALGAALQRLRMGSPASFDKDETMAVLDELARTPGLVGTVARFAKARIILRFEEQ